MSNRLLISTEDYAWCLSRWVGQETMNSTGFMANYELKVDWECFPATWMLANDIARNRFLKKFTNFCTIAPMAGMQHWRSEESRRRMLKFYRDNWKFLTQCALATASYVRAPGRKESMAQMVQLRQTYGPQFPITINPYHEFWGEEQYPEFPELTANGGVVLFQPEPGLLTRWKVRTPLEMLAEGRKQGFTGVNLSLIHAFRTWLPDDDERPDKGKRWNEALEVLLPYAGMVRVKMGGGYPARAMLTKVKWQGYAGPITIYGIRPGLFASRQAFIGAASEAIVQVRRILN